MNIQAILLEAKNSTALSDQLKILINDPDLRDKIYRAMTLSNVNEYHELLRHLLLEEMYYRKEGYSKIADATVDYAENIYYCGFLLYCIADLNDVLLLWQAKQIDFDMFVGFDVQYLVGAGIEQTLDYLHRLNSDDAQLARTYIQECVESGDFDEMDDWYRSKINYFRIGQL